MIVICCWCCFYELESSPISSLRCCKTRKCKDYWPLTLVVDSSLNSTIWLRNPLYTMYECCCKGYSSVWWCLATPMWIQMAPIIAPSSEVIILQDKQSFRIYWMNFQFQNIKFKGATSAASDFFRLGNIEHYLSQLNKYFAVYILFCCALFFILVFFMLHFIRPLASSITSVNRKKCRGHSTSSSSGTIPSLM